MTIVLASIQQETNSFSDIRPLLDDFDLADGEDMLARVAATPIFRTAGARLIPTIYANAVPSGPLPSAVLEELLARIIERIPDVPIDGVWLYLHGALEQEDPGSGDARIVARMREHVGPDVPIAVALDFHANNDPSIVEHANIVCGYRTAPHRDMDETQIRAARLLLRCIQEKILPHPQLVHIPLMVSGDMAITDNHPMTSIMAAAAREEEAPGILDVSVFHGQNWVDSPNAGASIIATAREDSKAALDAARRVATLYWSYRKDFRFQVPALEPEAAIRQAMTLGGSKVFISDSGDNTTAGASGESTLMLRLCLEARASGSLVAGIRDAFLVRSAWGAPPGTVFKLSLDDGSIVTGSLLRSSTILGWGGENAGEAVVLRFELPGQDPQGEACHVEAIFTQKRCAITSPQILRSVGYEVEDCRIIVVKLGYLYPALAAVASQAILALTPGASCEAIERLSFSRIHRPVYPMEDFVWSPEAAGTGSKPDAQEDR